jgi:hypothetical protein
MVPQEALVPFAQEGLMSEARKGWQQWKTDSTYSNYYTLTM